MKFTLLLFLFLVCMISCTSIYKANPAQSELSRKSAMPPDTLLKKQLDGIDFISSGNDPVPWSLEFDALKGFAFKSGDMGSLLGSPVAPTNGGVGNVENYRIQTDSGIMQVNIYTEPCANKNTKIEIRSDVIINNKIYKGCGSWLYDYLLNDIWVLEYIDNNPIDPSGYKKQMPTLEFQLADNKMNGYSGCNNISSAIEIKGNHIKFSAFTGARKSCPGKAEEIFYSKLSGRTVDYTVKDRRLTLYLIDDSRIIFSKKE